MSKLEKYLEAVSNQTLMYWLGVSLDSNSKNIVLVGSFNEKSMDEFAEELKSNNDITVFSVDKYGKSTQKEAENYFKNRNIKDVLYNKIKNNKDLVSNIYKELK